MPRTRVHNMNISLDGYAAGEHVTFDAPIGGAERLFTWFDGRVIQGVDKADAPVTLDRALTSMWSQGIGAVVYYWQHAHGFWAHLWAIGEAILWPAFLVYHLLAHIHA